MTKAGRIRLGTTFVLRFQQRVTPSFPRLVSRKQPVAAAAATALARIAYVTWYDRQQQLQQQPLATPTISECNRRALSETDWGAGNGDSKSYTGRNNYLSSMTMAYTTLSAFTIAETMFGSTLGVRSYKRTRS